MRFFSATALLVGALCTTLPAPSRAEPPGVEPAARQPAGSEPAGSNPDASADDDSASVDESLAMAIAAAAAGRTREALAHADRAVEAEDDHRPARIVRARLLAREREYERALRDLDRAIALAPTEADGFYLRGRSRFRAGDVPGAIADFERHLELQPRARPHLWEYGIALYYVGKFREGAALFTEHRTVNPRDVENAAWWYLCKARADGAEAARGELFETPGDARVPMRQIHALYRGDAEPADVLAAATAGQLSEPQRRQHLFYAHLYLGLYWEAAGDAAKSRKHLVQAVGNYKIGHYMWDVARVHVARLAPPP